MPGVPGGGFGRGGGIGQFFPPVVPQVAQTGPVGDAGVAAVPVGGTTVAGHETVPAVQQQQQPREDHHQHQQQQQQQEAADLPVMAAAAATVDDAPAAAVAAVADEQEQEDADAADGATSS